MPLTLPYAIVPYQDLSSILLWLRSRLVPWWPVDHDCGLTPRDPRDGDLDIKDKWGPNRWDTLLTLPTRNSIKYLKNNEQVDSSGRVTFYEHLTTSLTLPLTRVSPVSLLRCGPGKGTELVSPYHWPVCFQPAYWGVDQGKGQNSLVSPHHWPVCLQPAYWGVNQGKGQNSLVSPHHWPVCLQPAYWGVNQGKGQNSSLVSPYHWPVCLQPAYWGVGREGTELTTSLASSQTHVFSATLVRCGSGEGTELPNSLNSSLTRVSSQLC